MPSFKGLAQNFLCDLITSPLWCVCACHFCQFPHIFYLLLAAIFSQSKGSPPTPVPDTCLCLWARRLSALSSKATLPKKTSWCFVKSIVLFPFWFSVFLPHSRLSEKLRDPCKKLPCTRSPFPSYVLSYLLYHCSFPVSIMHINNECMLFLLNHLISWRHFH